MIRPATQDDAAALAALWNPWITDTAITFAATAKTPADMAHMIATRPAFFTTHDLQGFATYGQFRSGDGYATCMEHSIILGPNARGQGLGALLLHAVESHARAHGAHQMIADLGRKSRRDPLSCPPGLSPDRRDRTGRSQIRPFHSPCADAEIPDLTLLQPSAIVGHMSIWSRIAAALSALTNGEGFSAVLDSFRASPAPQRSVAFTIAVIALGAKMAKADGTVTRNEVAAFRRVFAIPQTEEANAALVFNLARQDVAGYDAYATKIRAMFRNDDREVLIDLMEGLFHIALADGHYHARENEFLMQVASIFGLDDRCFRQLRARFVDTAPRDPYDVLGVTPETPIETIRTAWRNAVKTSHPDVMMARGVPHEALKIAERRLQAVNEAWDVISKKAA